MDSPNAYMVDEKTLNSQPEHHTEPPGGSSGKLWSMCLTEAEKKDKEMVEMWKGEADTILIFSGLFTAVITVSIIESYKWLSPDPGDDTVDLLKQMSQQFFNASNGIPVQEIVQKPFKRTGSVVLVNVTWLCSVGLCFACSIAASMAQQCARRYLLLTQGRGTPYERAQLRMFMFIGLGTFRMNRIFQFLAMVLHISILLYCVGLIGFIFRIYKTVGLLAIAALALAIVLYAIFTAIPIYWMNSPIATPFTPLAWRLHHGSLLMFFETIRRVFRTFPTIPRTPQAVSWVKERVCRHRQRWLNGIRGTLELDATEGLLAQVAVKALRVEETLTALVENNSDKEIEDIAAWVPEFFDTYTPSGASEVPLMSDPPPTNLIFGSRLHHLLKTCISGTSGLEEEKRKKRLQACLECLWYWVKAYTGEQNSVPLPSHFPLPNPDTTRRLRAEQYPTAGITGRCFGALVAKKLAVNVSSPYSVVHSRDAKLESLSAILGTTSTEVETLLSRPGAIGLANIVSLTSSGMDTLVTEEVPPKVLNIFRTTVDVLLADDFLTSLDAELPPDLVASFHETYSNAQRLQAPAWLVEKLRQISQKLSVVSDGGQAREVTFESA
ncbi:hypothetical protein EDB83DRAFT_2354291 [Lactarius deliciosus]|nr:hypothetical protein EDB83DRAFT_2354291 [Lactarius deliciosus]